MFRVLWYFFIFLVLFGIIAYNILYGIKEITFFEYILIMMINSALLLALFWFIEFLKNCIFTGVPYMNRNLAQKYDIIKNVSMFWIYGKIIDLVLYSILLVSSLLLKDSIEDLLTQNNIAGIILFTCYSLELIFNEIVPSFLSFDKHYIKSFEMSNCYFDKSLISDENDLVIGKDKFEEKGGRFSEYEKGSDFNETLRECRNFESLRKASIEEIEGFFGSSLKPDILSNKSNSKAKTKMNADISINSFDSRANFSFEKSLWKSLGSASLSLKDLNLSKDVIFGTLNSNCLGKIFIGNYKGYDVKQIIMLGESKRNRIEKFESVYDKTDSIRNKKMEKN